MDVRPFVSSLVKALVGKHFLDLTFATTLLLLFEYRLSCGQPGPEVAKWTKDLNVGSEGAVIELVHRNCQQCSMVFECLTFELPGTQQAPRSGIMQLRVRAEMLDGNFYFSKLF